METKIRERPILFAGPMVRAILDGQKTVTRRIIKPQPSSSDVSLYGGKIHCGVLYHPDIDVPIGGYGFESEYFQWKCPYGQPGDRLWVRETFCHKHDGDGIVYNADGNFDPSCFHYRADGYHVVKVDGDGFTEFTKDGREASPWKPSIFMPRRASRITLEIVSVRVERLQEINPFDVIKEGFDPGTDKSGHNEISRFALTWDSLNGRGAWASNPWVWRIEFKRINN